MKPSRRRGVEVGGELFEVLMFEEIVRGLLARKSVASNSLASAIRGLAIEPIRSRKEISGAGEFLFSDSFPAAN